MNERDKPAAEGLPDPAGAVSTAQPSKTSPASKAPAPAATPSPATVRPQKALSDPDEAPAIPRDEFHGVGGRYVLIDGKRTPIDEDGKPRTAAKK